jgi:probable HAF family extracellular repeat protein
MRQNACRNRRLGLLSGIIALAALPSAFGQRYKITDLGTLGGTYSQAFTIGNNGAVVGEASITTGDVHGFVVENGVMLDVSTNSNLLVSVRSLREGAEHRGCN